MGRPRAATVVLPVYQTTDRVGTLLRDLAVAAYALRPRGIELDVLILADDAPGLAGAVDEAASLGLAVEGAPGPPEGVGDAFLAGFRRVVEGARVDLVVTLDANGRHDATEIPRLVDQLVEERLDVVIGSRWTRGSGTPGLSFARWCLGKGANLAFRWATGTRDIGDATTSFRIARVEVVREFLEDSAPLTSHQLQAAFVARAIARGRRVGEGPIIYRPGDDTGAMRWSNVGAYLRQLVTLRREVGTLRRSRLSPAGRVFVDDDFGAADDIERLGTAKYFFDWVIDEFDPYIKGRLLEVGAGSGTITRLLLERYPDVTVLALEPAPNMYAELEPVAALDPRVTAIPRTLAELRSNDDWDEEGSFDGVVYLNVLEHIEDDRAELQQAAAAVRPGGALFVFGPALEWLYSDLDHKAGHYRRYTPRRLAAVAEDAGFEVLSCRYFDVLGVLPYFVVYRVLRRTDIPGSTMWGYDRVIVPLSRLIQRALGDPPLGKNVIMVARRR